VSLDRQNPRRLPGCRKDHIKALACGGPDAVWNMQWQTVADARAKDAWELKTCAHCRPACCPLYGGMLLTVPLASRRVTT
jgi:hypothetical protein